MRYAKDFAPNLFKSYEAWLCNYTEYFNMQPNEEEKRAAAVYFDTTEEEYAQDCSSEGINNIFNEYLE